MAAESISVTGPGTENGCLTAGRDQRNKVVSVVFIKPTIIY